MGYARKERKIDNVEIKIIMFVIELGVKSKKEKTRKKN